MKAGTPSRSIVSQNIPLIWRLRLVLHGVRLSPFAHDDLTTTHGARLVAYRVQMNGSELIGAAAAPIDARVNIRAASFVLRHFGLQFADLRTDARGALLAVDTRTGDRAARVPPAARSASAVARASGAGCRH